MRRLFFLLPLIAFVAVAGYFAVGLTRDPSKLPSVLIDRPIPEFKLPAVAGTNVPGLSSETIRGRIALVNVFASWCVPCRIEHPILLRLASEKRVAIFGINYKDWHEDAAAWLGELGNPYEAIGYDDTGRVGIEWGVYGVPETFLIDRDGRIRFKHIGPITPQLLNETILPAIAALQK
ncbi:MAG: DsbE family thiol:disulfide interchange protein [Rhodospirillales bacterium]|nr:DsbE family thiol:disulfide interchange protein [Rhodospirillales bacterium]